MSSLPLGNTTDIDGFSPADFADAEDTRPIQASLDITGSGSNTPYATLVNNVLQRHFVEIKDKSVSPSPLPNQWRKRLREFMATKNEDLIQFLKKPLVQPTFVRADNFLQKFGRQDFIPTHASLLQTFLDLSGSSQLSKIQEEIKLFGPSTPKEIIDQVRWLYDTYRQAGEECIRQENALKMKLDTLDKIYQKIVAFYELPPNEELEQMGDAMVKYMKKVLEDHSVEENYTATVEAYRRFASLKEMIQFFRFIDIQDKEPLCSICLTDTVSFALTPCGHTLCATCMKRQNNTCFMCRATIRDRVKIYFT